MAVREYQFTFTITCASAGDADMKRVEEMIDLNMQDLVFDDEFIRALDENQSVTIQVTPNFGQTIG
jgi:archaellin